MKTVQVKVFGRFRNFFPQGEISLEVPDICLNAGSYKKLLLAKMKSLSPDFQDQDLIELSALADETRVLLNEDIVTSETLAILPPVCGG